jgi:hypothetical protein
MYLKLWWTDYCNLEAITEKKHKVGTERTKHSEENILK